MAPVPRDRDAGRQREVRQCLESWQTAQGSSVNVALNVDNIGLANLQSTGYNAQPSPDRALAAFAQLAVLRLGVERAMVSLIDASTQTILVEATRSDNITVDGSSWRPPSDLWLGTTVLARHDAVCEHCLSNTYTATSTGPDGSQHSYTSNAFIVPDCSLDPRFQNRHYVRDSPFIRFYAGVPIISRSGYKIGAYAVSDGKPREGLSIQDVQFMQGMAQTVMEHLEWARDRVDRFKGERIVRGLAVFIENSSGTAGDGTHSRGVSLASRKRPPSRPPPQLTITSPRHPLSRQNSYFGKHHGSDSGDTPDGPAAHHPHEALPSPAPPEQQKPAAKNGAASANKSEVDAMFIMLRQAAEILCQSTLADGAVLLGASASSSRQTSWLRTEHDQHSSDEDDPLSMVSEASQLPQDLSENLASPTSFRAEKLSRVLAYAINDPKTQARFEQGRGGLTLGTLESYYSRFPKGRVFSFTGQGTTITSEDDSSTSDRDTSHDRPHRSAGGKHARRPDHTELLQSIPDAKTVIFLPLFDHTENNFSGGCFLWTSVTGRLMTLDEDLSYLRAFANSIMSQVSRINAQKNEAAKTTFIASMSHELRSPLHGILGAAEFLADTTTSDSFQTGLVSSISTCGRTLLDTLNHVLDFSKINRLSRSQLRRSAKYDKSNSVASDSLDSMNLTAVVDLSAMVEEVVDTIVMGHTFKRTPGLVTSQQDHSPSLIRRIINAEDEGLGPLSLNRDEPVSVLLDISPPGSWLVRTQPGALRRIVMNLFGNSLKYTLAGYVLVRLNIKQMKESAETELLIRVIDTGKGMSANFQRDKLFVPFMQEDSFQPGTGLGLSIVKQIVDSIGGSIDVTSQQGKGTEIDVRARLPTAEQQGVVDKELAWVRKHARGLTMVLLDCDTERQAGKAAARHAARLNQTIAKTCESWFGLNVLQEQDGAGLDADIYMYCEPPSLDTLEKRFRHDKVLSVRKWQVPVIIVCLDAQEVLRISRGQKQTLAKGFGRIVELVPQPCGPRKLAKVIEICLRKAAELAGKSMPDTHGLLLPMPFEARKQSPTREEMERRNEMSHKEHTQNILQTDPTSIPMRPMDHWAGQSGAGGGKLDGDTKDIKDVASEKLELNAKTTKQTESMHMAHLKRSGPSENDMSDAKRSASTSPEDSQEEYGQAQKSAPSLGTVVEQRDTRMPAKGSHPLHVLVVDDNKINLQLLVMFMKKSGFSYEEAGNGQEALDKYTAACQNGNDENGESRSPKHRSTKTRRFDWVLMDISMPVMDGIESTTQIRRFERDNELKPAIIVALTGLASGEAQHDAKAAGVDIFMAKPVRFAALKQTMVDSTAADLAQQQQHQQIARPGAEYKENGDDGEAPRGRPW